MTLDTEFISRSPISHFMSQQIEPSSSEVTEMSQYQSPVEFRYKQDFSNNCPWCDAEIEYQRLVQLVELGKQIGFALTTEQQDESKLFGRKKKRMTEKNCVCKLFYKALPCAPQIQIQENGDIVSVSTEANKQLFNALVFVQILRPCEIVFKNCQLQKCYLNAPNALMIHLGGCNITEFDASEFPSLLELVLWDTNVANLDISQNPQLQLLNISGTLVTNLDVTHNPDLANLSIEDTRIGILDLKNCRALQKLFVGNSDITELDLSEQQMLTLLDVNECRISNLDLTNCVSLKYLYADFTQIECLDMTKCLEIAEISIKDARIAHKRNILLSGGTSCKITK